MVAESRAAHHSPPEPSVDVSDRVSVLCCCESVPRSNGFWNAWVLVPHACCRGLKHLLYSMLHTRYAFGRLGRRYASLPICPSAYVVHPGLGVSTGQTYVLADVVGVSC